MITHEGYRYSLRYVTQFKRKLPKLTFTPYGTDTLIKAEIMRNANLGIDTYKERQLDNLRKEMAFRKARDNEDRVLTRRFNSYWNLYWVTIAKALETFQDPQERFTKTGEAISGPIRLLMGEAGIEPAKVAEFKPEKPYDQVLADLE